MKKMLVSMMAAAAIVGAASGAQAQTSPFSLEVRGGLAFPTGDLSDADVESGVALNVNGQFMFTPNFGAYAEFNWLQFGIEDADDADVTDMGFGGGVVLRAPMAGFTPFAKVGVIFHNMEVSEGDVSEDVEDEQLGFRVGGGIEIPLGQRLSFTPAVTYTKYGIDEIDFDVSHITVDVGLKIRI